MNHKFTIINEHVRSNAIAAITALPLEPVHDVAIKVQTTNRSVLQNSLYWLWITILAGERGETKDYIHHECKKNFLIYIYGRDDIEYATMINAVKRVHNVGMKADAAHLADEIVKLTSTTTANIAQFTEYLGDIEKAALANSGICLPHPEDRYYAAMGIKRRAN